jgi:hypothetical protein
LSDSHAISHANANNSGSYYLDVPSSQSASNISASYTHRPANYNGQLMARFAPRLKVYTPCTLFTLLVYIYMRSCCHECLKYGGEQPEILQLLLQGSYGQTLSSTCQHHPSSVVYLAPSYHGSLAYCISFINCFLPNCLCLSVQPDDPTHQLFQSLFSKS